MTHITGSRVIGNHAEMGEPRTEASCAGNFFGKEVRYRR